MEEQLEEKIRLLGEILTKKVEKEFPVYEEDWGYGKFGAVGPYHNLVGYAKREVFLYLEAVRKKARKKLKKLSKKLKNRYLDIETREEFNKYFKIAKRESKGNLRIKINKGVVTIITLGIAGLIGLGVRDCSREERKKAIPLPIIYLSDKNSIEEYNEKIEFFKNRLEYDRFCYIYKSGKWEKVNLVESYEDGIRRANERIDAFKEHTKENLEKGYLTLEHRFWKDYEKVFGKEDWWPNSNMAKKK